MTAINALATKHAAYILTDSCTYDQDSIVRGFHCKAVPMPHLGCAVAVTGVAKSGQKVELLLREYATFEDVIAKFPAHLEDIVMAGMFDEPSVFGDVPDVDYDRDFRITLVGWSNERQCGEVYGISSTPEPDGSEPFELHKAEILLTPGPGMDQLAAAGLLDPDGRLLSADLVGTFVKIIDVQRQMAHPVPHEEGRLRHTVGGAGILTKIDKDGITQLVVRRWPDQVGFKIDPTVPSADGGTPLPSNVTPMMNRQQRRAAARAAGR